MIIYQLAPVPHRCETGFSKTVCALGLFDGVHLGHTALLSRAVTVAKETGATPIVFTFSDGNYKNKDGLRPPLCTLEERLALFAAHGIEYAVIAEFPQICVQTPKEFVTEVLCDRLQVQCAVCGSDFRFGAQGAGDAQCLTELMQQAGREVCCLPPVCFGAGTDLPLTHEAAPAPISTTVIRKLLQRGELEDAARLLGRPFSVSASVRAGYQIGRTWGYPTANLTIPKEKQLLPLGVYACRCHTQDGTCWNAVGNWGRCPTVRDGGEIHLEVFLFCEDAPDLYGKALTVDLMHFLRPEEKFASVEALQEEIGRNVAQAKTLLEMEKEV